MLSGSRPIPPVYKPEQGVLQWKPWIILTGMKTDPVPQNQIRYKKWSKTPEAEKLRHLEKSVGVRLNGIAFFLANNPPIKDND